MLEEERTMTPTAFIVLGLLERLGPASPYEVKQQATATLGNFWSTPHSQIYRTTEGLAAAGLLSVRAETTPGGRGRTVYALTREGRAALTAERRHTAADLPELRDPALLRLYFGADPAPLAVEQLAAHRRQLAAYEARRAQDDGAEPRGPWLTLRAGIGHEREWIKFWRDLAGGPDGQPRQVAGSDG